MARLINVMFFTVVIAIALYIAGYIFHIEWLMLYYERYQGGYMVETGNSYVPITLGVIGSILVSKWIMRGRKY